MDDVESAARTDDRGVESEVVIELRVGSNDPPVGTVALAKRAELGASAFVGWLGLLRALDDVLRTGTKEPRTI